MDIVKENVDALNARLKVRIEKPDYDDRVNEVLKDYRKKARMDGFRPGKIPQGLIRKMYYKPVLVEEVNKLVSESISNYLAENKVRILGEPLPSEEEQKSIDWENQDDFEFTFDLGLAPEFDLELGARDKIPYYEITIDKELLDTYKNSYARRFGSVIPQDEIREKELVRGDLCQIDAEGNLVEEGIQSEDATVSVEMIKDASVKRQFTGKKAGDEVEFNIKKAFPNDSEVSSLLKISSDQVREIAPMFRLKINAINLFEPAEINRELFDKVYGEGQVKTEEEFEERLKQEIRINLRRESEYKFNTDVRDHLLKKAKFDLPEEFLKRWLVVANEGKYTAEQIDEDFPKFEDDLKWQLIRDKIVKENDLKVTEDEAFGFAREYALMQFQQYGLSSVPDEQLDSYAREILNNQQEKRRIYDQLYDRKVTAHVRQVVKVDEKEVSKEKFNKLLEK